MVFNPLSGDDDFFIAPHSGGHLARVEVLVEWKPDDFVVTTQTELAHYDGGMAVMLAAGCIGRLVTGISGGFFGSWLVNFSGNNYWVKTKFLKRVEVLDVLADL